MVPKILIVEDDSILGKNLSTSLKTAGYKITGRVSTAEEAIQMVEESKPDVVLMGIHLQGEMDGVEVAAIIRNRHDVPTVHLTEICGEDVPESAQKTEPYGYLSKPAILTELKNTIEKTQYKHKADRRVRTSEHELRLVTDSLGSLLARVDSEQRYLWTNRAYQRFFGLSSSEIRGRHVRDVLGNRTHSSILHYIESAFSGEKVSFETSTHDHSGELRHLSVTYVPDAKSDGTVQGFIVQAVDITDRKKAEEALRESERRYRQMFERNDEVKILIDPESGNIVEANTTASTFYGYTVDQLKKLKITDINTLPRQEVFEEMARAKAEHKRYFLFRHKLASGEIRDVEVYSGPVDTPERTLLYSIVHDITDRKRTEEELRESEALFRTIFDNASVGVCLVGTDGKFLRVNPTMCQLLGYTDEELCQMEFNDITCGEDRDIGETFVNRALSGNADTTSFEKRYIHKSGSVVWAQVSSTVFRRPTGEPKYFITHILDITDRKQLEQDRLANMRFLESVDRVNRALRGTNDIEQMMGDFLHAVLSIFDCDRAWLFYPCDPDAPSFRVPMEITKPEYPGAKALNVDLPMPQDMAQNLREALESFGPVTYTAGTERPINKLSADQFAVKSMMMVALYPKSGKPWAFGLHQCSYPRVWTSEEERLFREIGLRLTDGLSVLLAHRELQNSEERFRLLYEHAPLAYQSLDESGNLLAVNQAWLNTLGYSHDEVIGKWCGNYLTEAYREKFRAYFTQFKAAGEIHGAEFEMAKKDGSTILIAANGKIARDARGQFRQTHCILHDITERKKSEKILKARLALTEYAHTHTLDELLQETLDTAESLTDSRIGFFVFVEADQKTLSLQMWSTNTLDKMCTAEGKGKQYSIEEAGVWVDCIHQRGPVIHNDHAALTHRKGMPTGHAPVKRELVVPVFQGDDIVAIIVVGNKPSDYCEADVETVSQLANFTWDIVMRKRAEEEVHRRDAFLNTVIESLTHPFYIVNTDDYTIALANTAALESGIPERTTCYAATHGLTAPCHDEQHVCPMEILKSTGQPTMVEHVHCDEKGRSRNIEVHAYPIFDAERKVKQIIEYCIDVTDRIQALEALRDNERTLRTILSMSPSGIGYFREGRLAWANAAMIELFGYDEDQTNEWLGKTPQEFYESEDEYGRVRGIFEERIAGKLPLVTEARFRRNDGTVFFGEVLVSSQFGDSESLGTTVVISDITQRKTAEEERLRLMTAIEQSAETIVITDYEASIQYVNPSFESVSGYPREEAVGQNPRILKSGEQSDEFYKEMWTTLTGGNVWRGHFVNRKKDGTLFEEDATISPVTDESGNIVNYVAVKRDVTDKILLEKQLQQAQKMESIGTLAGGIAHDFNNLLQIVLGYADILLMNEEARVPDRRNLETIKKATMDGRDLVKGLLTFSRQVESELRPVDMSLQLRQLQGILRRTIPRMIEIELALAEDVNLVNADPIQVEQVILNLVVNAQHAMPKGGKLTIGTRNITLDDDYCRTDAEAKPGEHVLLKITDTGHGMDQKTLERIFEPFFTTKEEGEGTGLGLSIVYGIVKNHGGHIKCSSEPGKGTTFTIYLPALSYEAEFDPAKTLGEITALGTETILVVDDEELVRNMFEQTLTQRGYRVFTAEDGKQALRVFRGKMEEIDLVILDLIMPEIGGEQCLDEILKIDPGARILIASGYLVEKSRNAVLERGACGFIEKPCDAGSLLREVRKTLDESGFLVTRVGRSRTDSVQGSEAKETASPTPNLVSTSSQFQETLGTDEFPWRLRILAIDDREPYLEVLKVGLTQFGQNPLTASSGTEGLQAFQEKPVDLVICDLEMPELDGWEVGRRIKEICREKDIPKTPLILLTGQTDMEDIRLENEEKIFDCGVDAILGKPIDIPDIMKVAERLISKSARKIPSE